MKSKKRWTLTIPDAYPSANIYMHLHWTKRRKMKKAWAWLLIAAGVRRIPAASGRPRRVTITRRGPKAVDPGNRVLAADKLILDALVNEGVLVDDAECWCDLKMRGEIGEARTTVVIEECL